MEVSQSRSQSVRLLYSPAVRRPAQPLCGMARIRGLSLIGTSSPGYVGARAAGHSGCAYPGEPGRMGVNCNPNCNLVGHVIPAQRVAGPVMASTTTMAMGRRLGGECSLLLAETT